MLYQSSNTDKTSFNLGKQADFPFRSYELQRFNCGMKQSELFLMVVEGCMIC